MRAAATKHLVLVGVAAALVVCTLAGQSLEVEITADNCPVYEGPRRDAEKVVSTVHSGSRFPVMESRRVGPSDVFYRIRYSQRDSDLGWVHADWARVSARAARPVAASAGPAPETDLHTRISRLIDVYNEEKSALTVGYRLRPFPSFSVDSDSAGMLAGPGTIRVPLTYTHEEKLSLERSTKFLLQLVLRECFSGPSVPDLVEVAIRFTSGKSVTLAYRLTDWRIYGERGLDEFWGGMTSPAKDTLWQ